MDLAHAKQEGKKWLRRILIGGVLLVVVCVTLYTLFTLHYSYSSGERVGVVQKMSKKGWICKTNEGDMAVVTTGAGQQTQTFTFTVPDDKVMADIDALAGHRVELHYEQHKGVPLSCWGDTEYFVTGVKKAD